MPNTFPTCLSEKMPSKNNSRNSSRKSTSSSHGHGKPSVSVSVSMPSEDDFASIVMVNKPSSRKSTPKSNQLAISVSLDSPRPDFLEPLSPKPITPPPKPWDTLGMAEPEYHAMMARVQKTYRDMDKAIYQQNLLDEMNDPRFWKKRIDHLEHEREYFNRKPGWSAVDMACVDRIDAMIQECEKELDRIYAEEDRLEAAYD